MKIKGNYTTKIKEWIIFSFTVVFIFLLAWTIYAGVNNIWTEPNKLEASPNQELTADSWNKILSNMNAFSWAISWWLAVPSGWVLAFYRESCPEWWKAADGSNNTPDLRWKFIRWLNNFNWDNWVLTGTGSDLDRGDTEWLWSYQVDQMRVIKWYTGWQNASLWQTPPFTNLWAWYSDDGTGSRYSSKLYMDTALLGINYSGLDTHPKNVALIYCIKE